ncbi:hypothetical protein LINPERPRIM_LOCUS35871, partial [Linum perenne]
FFFPQTLIAVNPNPYFKPLRRQPSLRNHRSRRPPHPLVIIASNAGVDILLLLLPRSTVASSEHSSGSGGWCLGLSI